MKLALRFTVLIEAFVVFLALASSALGSSGLKTITMDTTLNEDHYGNVWFGADGVTLDCAGHSVIGPGVAGPWPGVGIGVVARSGVTIRNCHVVGFLHGISLSGVTSFSLVGNTSAGNEKSGIVLGETAHGTLLRNVASSNGWWGFSGANVGDIQFVGNRAAGNGYDGFVIQSPWPQTHYVSGLRFIGNVSSANRGDGFHLNAFADGNTLTGNVASNSTAGHGFVIGSSNNTLTLNLALSNSYAGFITAGWPSPFFWPSVEPAVGNTLRFNVAHRNGVIGAAEYNKPGVNTWQGNWFDTTFGI